jgi:serine/threonine protein kinase
MTAGKFQLERQIGSGGMGVVYLATDLTLGRRVALKTLPRVSDSLAVRLQREARAMARVRHPNLALIYGAEQWRGSPVLIVEYLEGGTVLDGLRRGPFSVDEALGLGIVIADVLDRLHSAGVLHRDVKPSNIGYTLAGEPKLLDLGLAAAFAPHDDGEPSAEVRVVASLHGDYAVASDSRQLGTLRYMSPEALAGQAPKPSFDLWALCLVLYEVIAGRYPFAALEGDDLVAALRRAEFPDVREARPDCPPAIAAFFRQALAADSSRRPRTAADLRIALQSSLAASRPSTDPTRASAAGS